MRELQRKIRTGDLSEIESLNQEFSDPTPKTVPNGTRESTRSILFLDKSKLLACTPLKTGITNWKKAFAALMVYEKTDLYLEPMSHYRLGIMKTLQT